MAGEEVDLPAYVLAFRVGEKLGVPAWEVAEYLDEAAGERMAIYWVQAAVNLMTAEHKYRRDQENEQMGESSKQRARRKGRGTIGA
jgi:hypothetical protein